MNLTKWRGGYEAAYSEITRAVKCSCPRRKEDGNRQGHTNKEVSSKLGGTVCE